MTLKLPHKTGGSVSHNIDHTLALVSKEVRRISALAADPPPPSLSATTSSSDAVAVAVPQGLGCRAMYRVVHLMANLDSKRMLLVMINHEQQQL